MIVTEAQVEAALAYLNADPPPISLAKLDLTNAENHLERIYAELFLKVDGANVRERECKVESNENYINARDIFALATRDYEAERAKIRGAEMICEIWRSESANIRAAEKIR